MQGILRFLLGPSVEAQVLRERIVFNIVPMVNVDGVIYGNSRCTLAGVDPNRHWVDPNPIMHPTIYRLKVIRNI
jgi:murein tripeptide amidase MpaA